MTILYFIEEKFSAPSAFLIDFQSRAGLAAIECYDPKTEGVAAGIVR